MSEPTSIDPEPTCLPIVEAVTFANERTKAPTAWTGPLDALVGTSHRMAADRMNSPGFSPVEYVDGARRSKASVRHVTALCRCEACGESVRTEKAFSTRLRAAVHALVRAGAALPLRVADWPPDTLARRKAAVAREKRANGCVHPTVGVAASIGATAPPGGALAVRPDAFDVDRANVTGRTNR
jgi:hypothetical protein